MELKHEIKTVICVDYDDLGGLICKTYGVSDQFYDFVSDMECCNDSSHEFDVKKGDLFEWDKKELTKWKSGKHCVMMTETLLTDLCNQGIIDEGQYLVWVCW